MNNSEARRRALRAVLKAYEKSEAFEHGGMASGEVLDVVRDAIKAEFKTRAGQ